MKAEAMDRVTCGESIQEDCSEYIRDFLVYCQFLYLVWQSLSLRLTGLPKP